MTGRQVQAKVVEEANKAARLSADTLEKETEVVNLVVRIPNNGTLDKGNVLADQNVRFLAERYRNLQRGAGDPERINLNLEAELKLKETTKAAAAADADSGDQQDTSTDMADMAKASDAAWKDATTTIQLRRRGRMVEQTIFDTGCNDASLSAVGPPDFMPFDMLALKGGGEIRYLPMMYPAPPEDDEVSDATLIELGKSKPGLTALNISGSEITDAGVRKLAAGCKCLQVLFLCDCKQLTDAAVESLSQCVQLKSLNLDSTQVTDEGLKPLAKLPKLKELYLVNCRVTEAGIRELLKACPSIVFIPINLDPDTRDNLKKEFPAVTFEMPKRRLRP